MEQDTIENVSQPKEFEKEEKKSIYAFLTSIYATFQFGRYNVFNFSM